MLTHETTNTPKRETVQAPTEPTDLSRQNIANVQQLVRKLLGEQDYTGALNLTQNAINNGVNEQILSNEYLQAANGSLNKAETLMKQEHYPEAALLLKTVQASYPQSHELQQQVTATPAQLTDRINFCTEKLMDEGLVAYRSGEFTTAINFWQQILIFNPQHQAAQNSIQTTQLQVAKLKTLYSQD